ncbi:MAG: hypothetical protein KDK38_15380 [Leptospiraceae bacterium]|nr:hypothetical protein [Leptospiraceae bacterium]
MSYLFHALKTPANLWFLAAGFVAGIFITPAFFLIPYYWPAFFAVEGGILLATATNKRFQKSVNARLANEEEAYRFQRQRSQLRMGKAAYRDRMRKTEKKLHEIKKNHRSAISSRAPGLLSDILKRIDEIEHSYIILLYSFMKLEDLKNRNTEEHMLENLVEEIKAQMASATAAVKPALESRLKIISKRIENKNLLQENLDTISVRLAALDDTLDLLLEESVTGVDPEKVAAQVDAAMEKLEMTRETMSEIQTFSEISDPSFSLRSISRI